MSRYSSLAMSSINATSSIGNAVVRGYVWLALVVCYAIGVHATSAAVAGDGTSLVSPYNLAAVLLGTPTLVGYAASLWVRNALTTSAQRVEVALCTAYPVLVLLVGSAYALARSGA
jgi:hypothetical protein